MNDLDALAKLYHELRAQHAKTGKLLDEVLEVLNGHAQLRPVSPARTFLDWFQVEYKTRRKGACYFVVWSKHMPIVTRLLKLHEPARLQQHARVLLSTDDQWVEGTDRGIEVLAGKINWLEDKLTAWEAKQRGREAV